MTRMEMESHHCVVDEIPPLSYLFEFGWIRTVLTLLNSELDAETERELLDARTNS